MTAPSPSTLYQQSPREVRQFQAESAHGEAESEPALVLAAVLGMALVDRLEAALTGYRALHATRADLLRRLGRSRQSRTAYDAALALAGNTAEVAYLTRRRDRLGSTVAP